MDILPFGEAGFDLVVTQIPSAELEFADNTAKIRATYDALDLDALLHKFAFGESTQVTPDASAQLVDEDVVGDALLKYALQTTYIATHAATTELDTDLVKGAFDHVYGGMDAAIEAKLGPRPGMVQRVLAKAGVRTSSAEPRQHIARLDDTFWHEQFLAELERQTFVKRQPGDTDVGILARGVYFTLSTRVFSHFSYVPQAHQVR